MAEDTEAQRFFNFLQHYGLQKYHQKFLDMGVLKISHLKDVDDGDLEQVGLSRPERARLRKKLENNFSLTGKLKNSVLGKGNKFDGPSPEEKEKDPGQVQQQQQQQQHPSASPTIINNKQIKLGRQVGQGAYGAVHEATWSNVHGSVTVAIKYLLTTKPSDEAYQAFHKEVASMCALNHPHIIKLYGIILDSPVALVEELAPLGNLHSWLQKYGVPVKLQLLHKYACQIADAMQYLEAHRVIHRDLATRNILLIEEDCVKLGDFGMARVLSEHSNIYNLTSLNSRIPIAWSSLEALQRAKFSTASDVWSYGVTLWEIYSLGAVPWEGLAPVEVRDKLAVGERLGRPALCPVEIYQLMEACWNAVPSKRPTFQYIYQTIQELSPKKVLAIRSHLVDGESILSFKAGEVIYVIERPKPGWIFGVKVTGEKGHFQDEYVTTELDPLGKLKEMVQSGKAKANDLPISKPTFVAHDYHWGSDGKRWVSEDAPDGIEVTLPNGPTTSSAAINTMTPFTNSTSPPAERDRYSAMEPNQRYFAVEPAVPPPNDLLYQHHLLDEVIPPAVTQPALLQAGNGSTATNRLSPPGGCAVMDKFSPPVGYSVPPRRHSRDDDCSCQEQQHMYSLAGESHSQEDDPPLDEPDQYMTLTSPRAVEAKEEGEVAYLKMRSSPSIASRATSSVEYHGSFGPRRPDQPRAEIQVPPVEVGAVRDNMAASGRPAVRPVDKTAAYVPPSGGEITNGESPVPATRRRQGVPPPPVPLKPPPRQLLVSSPPGPSNSPVATTSGLLRPPTGQDVPVVLPKSPSRSASVYQQTGQTPVPPPRRNVSLTSMEPTPGSAKPSSVINTAHSDMPLVDVLLLEFPDMDPHTCKKILETHKYSLSEAKDYLKVEQLLAMGISNITVQDCRRALEHCQYSVDRAAGWLLDRSAEPGPR